MKVTAVPDELVTDQRTPAGAGAGPTVSESTPPSTGLRPTGLVDAIVVVHNGAAWLAQCLDGIAAQTLPPERLIVVDVASTDTSRAIARAHQRVRAVVTSVEIVALETLVPVGRAIDSGLRRLGGQPGDPGRSTWAWVLHDDCVPRANALALLLQAGTRSPSVGVVGPKIVSWEDSRRLVEVGIQVTRTGRRLGVPARGEADQGQYDDRTDVLAVSTCGMLVRRSVYDDLGGFDPSFVDEGVDLDFGWRAQLAGHRVVVVPQAVVREASAGLDGPRLGGPPAPGAEHRSRSAARQVALSRCSLLGAPFLVVWMVVAALVAALALLVAKRPRQAWRELTDLSAVFHPVRTLGARWRGRHTRRLRGGDLSTLFVAPSVAARLTLDRVQDAITPDTKVRREVAPTTETGPVAEESESLDNLPASLPRRILTHPGFVSVAAVLVATTVAWRDALRAGALSPTRTGLAGGELRPVTTDASGLWHAFRDAWHGAGLGSGAESGPHLAVLAGLTWLAERVPGIADSRSAAGVTIAWLLFLAPALAAWAAYLAGRVVTTSRTARAVAAFAWGTAGVLTTAVGQGRLTFAVAHVLLPFVLAGFCLAARRDGTFTSTFATALATAVLGAFAPPYLALSALAALVLLVVGPGLRRARALVLLLVPVALLGPWVARFVDDPRLLLSGPGLVATGAEPGGWAPATVATASGVGAWAWWLVAPVAVLGVLGYAARSRSRAESVGLAVGASLVVVGLAVTVVSGRVVLGTAETGVGQSGSAQLWEGVGLQLWFAGTVVGLLAGSRAVLAQLDRPGRRWGFVASIAAAALVMLPMAATAVMWSVEGTGRTLSVGQATLPAVAVEQGGGALANRLLVLRPSDDVVDFVLTGQEPGDLLRDLDRPAGADDRALVAAVAAFVGGRDSDALDSTALAKLGVGFVQARAGVDSAIARRIDSAEGLSRLGTSEQGILWKVRPLAPAAGVEASSAPARARLVDRSGHLLADIPTIGPHSAVDTTLDAGRAARYLVLAEPVEWADHAVVSFDGRVLAPVRGAPQPTYAVPTGAGQLTVDLAAAAPWWRVGQALLLGFVLFMALPFGNRRSRRRA